MVDLPRLARLNDERDLGPLLVANEMVVNSSRRDERTERDAVDSNVPIGKDDDPDVLRDRLTRFGADAVERVLVAGDALALVERDVDNLGGPVGVHLVEALEGVDLLDREDGRGEEEAMALGGVHLEKVAFGSDVAFERHDDRLANGVDGRVGDLGEELAEVVVDDARSGGHAGERSVVTLRAESQSAAERTEELSLASAPLIQEPPCHLRIDEPVSSRSNLTTNEK